MISPKKFAVSILVAWILVLVGSVTGPALRTYDGSLAPFSSDGCTIAGELYAWFDRVPPWDLHCRQVHDVAYWRGGPWHQRIRADWALAAHIASHGGWHRIESGVVFLFLLHVGGYPWPWRHYRWGGGRE